MTSNKFNFSLIKAVAFSLFFNVAMGAVMFLYASFKIDDMKAYIYQFLLFWCYSLLPIQISRGILTGRCYIMLLQ